MLDPWVSSTHQNAREPTAHLTTCYRGVGLVSQAAMRTKVKTSGTPSNGHARCRPDRRTGPRSTPGRSRRWWLRLPACLRVQRGCRTPSRWCLWRLCADLCSLGGDPGTPESNADMAVLSTCAISYTHLEATTPEGVLARRLFAHLAVSWWVPVVAVKEGKHLQSRPCAVVNEQRRQPSHGAAQGRRAVMCGAGRDAPHKAMQVRCRLQSLTFTTDTRRTTCVTKAAE